MTHARVTLSRAALVCGGERQAREQGSVARSSALAMGYGLLNHMYPEEVYDLGERIAGALMAYACGDALGVPWENAFQASAVPPASRVEQVPAREGWPRGVTSDDTALTLLVARHLAERDGGCDANAFLAELAEREPMIRGLGPTTTAAIERFRRGGEAVACLGRATNGAAMRALPIGWVLPHSQADRRREVAIEMSQATHPDASAVVAACVIAACASWALEGATPALLLRIAADEAREAARAMGIEARLAQTLTQVSTGTWQAPAEGVSLDPYDTVAAVLSCVGSAPSLRGGLVSAVQLGGDTDTVAALVGGLLGATLTVEQVRGELPWHHTVVLPEPESAMSEIAAALAMVRAVRSA
jgi:ADP-ribosyl-[dinitrogen reductase] hydrolase